jgi:hypothetical protein
MDETIEYRVELRCRGAWRSVYSGPRPAPASLRAELEKLASSSDQIDGFRFLKAATDPVTGQRLFLEIRENENTSAIDPNDVAYVIEARRDGDWIFVDGYDDRAEALSAAAAQEELGDFDAVRLLERNTNASGGVSLRDIPITRPPQPPALLAPERQMKSVSTKRLAIAAVLLVAVASAITIGRLLLDGSAGPHFASASRGAKDLAIGMPPTVQDLDPLMVLQGPALALTARQPTKLTGQWAADGVCEQGFVRFTSDEVVRTVSIGDPPPPARITGYSELDDEIVILFEGGDTEFIQMVDGGYVVVAKGRNGRRITFVPFEERIIMRPCAAERPFEPGDPHRRDPQAEKGPKDQLSKSNTPAPNG